MLMLLSLIQSLLNNIFIANTYIQYFSSHSTSTYNLHNMFLNIVFWIVEI